MRSVGWIVIAAACSAGPVRPTAHAGFEAGEAVLGEVKTAADVARLCDASKGTLAQLRDAMLAGDRGELRAVEAFDRAALTAMFTTDMLSQLHPDAAVRDAARTCNTAVEAARTEARGAPLLARLARVKEGSAAEHAYVARIIAIGELAGANLPPPAHAKLMQLREREAKVTQEMAEALGTPPQPVVVDAARLAGLPADFLAAHRADGAGKVTLSPIADWRAVATYATDHSLALELLRARRAVALPGNIARLHEVLEIRHEIAALLGCGAWAECQARVRMVGTRARTTQFLAEMTAMFAAVDPIYRAAFGLGPSERPLETDQKLYEQRVRDREGLHDADAITAHLSPDQVLDRMLAAVGAGTGLAFTPTTAPSWSPDVRVFDVMYGGKRIGRFYFDLYARPGKVGGAGMSFPFVAHTPGMRGDPVAVAISIPLEDRRAFVPANYIGLLMHELGHAIDFLFETESAMAPPEEDFFDVPSQMFERWAADPAFLAQLGLSPPDAASVSADLAWEAWDLDRYFIELTSLDLAFHGDAVPADPLALYVEADERMYPTRVDRDSHPEASLFIPSIAYAGNAHALPWGLAISTDLAGEFPHGFADPATWQRVFAQVFSAEGPADARIQAFLGRPWTTARLRPLLLPPLPR